MKKTFNHFAIANRNSGQILRMQELKRQIGETIDPSTFLYKNTMRQVRAEMKQVFGKILKEIPKTFIHNNCIWRSLTTTYTHKGRTYESFRFIPVFNLK